ncbi:right-handed parallel beta-helix repeat-containing protein, partial [Kitasatospora sp. NPDC004289]
MNPHAILGRLVPALLAAAALAVPAAPPAAATSGAHYLDCSAGSNGTGTESSPWNSLAAANAHLFGPGDQLLLKRGATCLGTLKPQGSGTANSPITLAGYGPSTARPVVRGDATSAEKAAVHLYNVEQWELRELEITFPDPAATKRE